MKRCIFRFLAIVLFINPAPFHPAPAPRSSCLAPSAGSALPFTARELLKTLGLLHPEKNKRIQILTDTRLKGGARQVDILIAKPAGDLRAARGVSILYWEFGKSRKFRLIYNRQGNCVAVLPLESKEAGIFYLDLSPYYFDVPARINVAARKAWKKFLAAWKEDRILIEEALRLTKSEVRIPVGLKKPFLFLACGEQQGLCVDEIRSFSPDEFPEIFSLARRRRAESKERLHQMIVPIFPTVYSPAEQSHLFTDDFYYDAFYHGFSPLNPRFWEPFHLEPEHRVLIVGPGSGIEVWLAKLKGVRQLWVSGISPLEDANARVVGRLAGVFVISRVFDNLLSPEGEPVFGEKFDRIYWNMPTFSISPRQNRITWLREFWDNNFSYSDLRYFARGLSRLLSPQGKAVLWNRSELKEQRPLFAEQGLTLSPVAEQGSYGLCLVGRRTGVVPPAAFERDTYSAVASSI